MLVMTQLRGSHSVLGAPFCKEDTSVPPRAHSLPSSGPTAVSVTKSSLSFPPATGLLSQHPRLCATFSGRPSLIH